MRVVLLLCVLLLCVPVVSAYRTDYRGVPVYVFHYKFDESACFETLDLIPFEHIEGIRAFRFYLGKARFANGLYFKQTRIISVLDGCGLDVLVHELAHFRQDREGVLVLGDSHNDDFYRFESEIWNDINEGYK